MRKYNINVFMIERDGIPEDYIVDSNKYIPEELKKSAINISKFMQRGMRKNNQKEFEINLEVRSG